MAITGKGSFPFRSSWNRKNIQYRKNFIFGDRDHIKVTIWSNWFFTGVEAEVFYQTVLGVLEQSGIVTKKKDTNLLGTLTFVSRIVKKTIMMNVRRMREKR